MRRTMALLLGMLWAFSLTMALLPLPASADPSFTINCAYVKSLPDDPIVHPDATSHRHAFWGNKGIDGTTAHSTYDYLIAQGTSCADAKDTAAYWAPSLFLNGVEQLGALKAYYYRRFSGTLTVPPADLRVVAGNSSATTAQSTSVVYFGCGNGSLIPKSSAPPDCGPSKTHLYVHISFPDCMKNVAVTHSNDTAALAYGKSGVCPSGYPVQLPQLVMRISYSGVVNATGITLSSGSYVTEHADVIQSWDQARLAELVATL